MIIARSADMYLWKLALYADRYLMGNSQCLIEKANATLKREGLNSTRSYGGEHAPMTAFIIGVH